MRDTLTNVDSPAADAAAAAAACFLQRRKMGNKGNSSGGGFGAKMEHYLYSGDKKHVFAGLIIISVAFGVPWYYMNRGAKHQSHQDYLEKARSERFSSTPSAER
ncbi:hypothetical protein V2J09_005327 [Rumex salicifolius]